ncbi:MAG: hypothetical protein O2923_00840 [Verrucomicrobia bacterium]|nr:hypothetical protein [Verrucomicrobiota bacterium]MDA1086120.1 hypothetical protein [Verrucomicrobiota bacterium]
MNRELTGQDRVELDFLAALHRRLPRDEDVIKALADLYTRAGEFDRGYELDLELVRLDPCDALVWYNLACSQALLHKKKEAFESLDRAVDLGYREVEHLRDDEDLQSLRDDPRFEGLMLRLTA